MMGPNELTELVRALKEAEVERLEVLRVAAAVAADIGAMHYAATRHARRIRTRAVRASDAISALLVEYRGEHEEREDGAAPSSARP